MTLRDALYLAIFAAAYLYTMWFLFSLREPGLTWLVCEVAQVCN